MSLAGCLPAARRRPSRAARTAAGAARPESSRLDLATPAFSNPTQIDNPLFPISNLRSVVLLGREEGRPFRSETTLLPGVGTVTWNGRRIPVVLSQYMAWRDGRLEEVARDRYPAGRPIGFHESCHTQLHHRRQRQCKGTVRVRRTPINHSHA